MTSNYSQASTSVPAYITLKFEQKCKACHEIIPVGKLAFYMKEGNQVWHGKCGAPSWKIAGTAYHTRRSIAIAHQLSQKTDKDLIKLALRRFRKELIIPTIELNLKAEVFMYLKRNHLIEEDEYKKAYVIIPKGFNWNVDEDCVKMPDLDEDIKERDQEVEPVIED